MAEKTAPRPSLARLAALLDSRATSAAAARIDAPAKARKRGRDADAPAA